MKEVIIGVIAFIFSIIYNIMVLGTYALHEKVEFKNICLAFIIINTIKDTILFSILLNNAF